MKRILLMLMMAVVGVTAWADELLYTGMTPAGATTRGGSDSRPAYYVYRKSGGGLIIRGADSRQREVLGIIDGVNDFDINMIPPAMRAWLDGYAVEVAELSPAAEDSNIRSISGKPEDWKPINPLLGMKWGQQYPYNLKVPKEWVTGCVATAMAQVVKHHGFAAPRGSVSYLCTELGQNLSYTFDGKQFNFSNMLASYDGGSNETQRDAVAELMLACGMAVEMQYTSGESGVSLATAAPGLVNYLGYDPRGTVAYNRSSYSDLEWEGMVYEELECGRPVLYGGFSNGGGHAFVCDGYDGDGLFHINWGWKGVYDGYFPLSSLDPYRPRLESQDGYRYGQVLVTVARPDDQQIVDRTRFEGAFTSATTTSLGIYLRMSGSRADKQLGLGVMAEGEDGKRRYVELTDRDYKADELLAGVNVTLPAGFGKTLGGGRWTLRPAVREEGKEAVEALPIVSRPYTVESMTDASGNVLFAVLGAAYVRKLSVSNLVEVQQLVVGKDAQLRFDVFNPNATEFNDYLGIVISPDDPCDGMNSLVAVYVKVGAGATAQVTTEPFSLYSKEFTFKPGDYNLWFINLDTQVRMTENFFKVRLREKEDAGVSEIGSIPESEEWYSLDGLKLEQPKGLCLRRVRLANGRVRVEKVVVK